MIYLLKDDYFEVYLASMITSNDKDVIYMLYQPILGHDAVSLYFSLYSEFKKQESVMFSTHESLSDLMNLPLNRIQEARRTLEGIGLLRTYYLKKDDQVNYKYVLFAPKSPSDFFNDVLLKGLLVRNIGAKKANQLANMYKSKELDLEGYEEISEKFTSVFHPDLDSNAFSTNIEIDKSFKRKTMDITKEFDRGLFLDSLEKNFRIKSKAIKKVELDELSKLALLYGIEEVVLSDYVAQSVRPNGIDFDMVKKLCLRDQNYSFVGNKSFQSKDVYGGKSDLAKKIELMSSISAFDFLKIKQNNTSPSPSDLKLIEDLSSEFGLTSQVINPLVDYVLENYNNTLPKNLVLKIAASLVRSNINSTLDAMNYLHKVKNKKIAKPVETKPVEINSEDDDLSILLDEIGDN